MNHKLKKEKKWVAIHKWVAVHKEFDINHNIHITTAGDFDDYTSCLKWCQGTWPDFNYKPYLKQKKKMQIRKIQNEKI